MKQINIAFADDHSLFRHALIKTIDSFKDFKVTMQAENGKQLLELLDRVEKADLPDIVLMDISMPVMNGFEATELVRKKYPEIKIIVVTMIDDRDTMLKLVKSGINGYITKDASGDVLQKALNEVVSKGSYFTDDIKEKLIQSLQAQNLNEQNNIASVWSSLTEVEKKFVQLSCSEKTYAEIANEMSLPSKVIEAHRQAIFSRFGVKTRVGLALVALRNNLV